MRGSCARPLLLRWVMANDKDTRGLGMTIGISVGLALGAVIGLATDNLVLAMSVGFPLAAGLGVAGAFVRLKVKD